MTYPPGRMQPSWDYEDAEEAAHQLEAILRANGITIQSGSYLETHVLEVFRLVDHKRRRTGRAIEPDFRAAYRSLVGVHELAQLIIAADQAGQIQPLIPHLQLLNHGSALQLLPSSGVDQATNKIFELMVGAMSAQCGSDVALDDPKRSAGGSNPDVMVTISGQRWGLACKVLHSLHPEGFITHLEKGIEQIERSEADVGAVVFNLKNVLDHDEIWPLAPIPADIDGESDMGPGGWRHYELPYDLFMRQVLSVGQTLAKYLPVGYLDTVFQGKKSVPAFLLWGHSVTGIQVNGAAAPASVRTLTAQQLNPVAAKDLRAIECLNWAAFAGSSGRGARPDC